MAAVVPYFAGACKALSALRSYALDVSMNLKLQHSRFSNGTNGQRTKPKLRHYRFFQQTHFLRG